MKFPEFVNELMAMNDKFLEKKFGIIKVIPNSNFARKVKDFTYSYVTVSDFYYGNLVGTSTPCPEPHITILFGIEDVSNIEVTNAFYSYFNNKNKVAPVKITGVDVFPGRENKYKVIYLAIEDIHGVLNGLRECLLNLLPTKKQDFEFKPHLTLAYVDNSFDESKLSVNCKFSDNILFLSDFIYKSNTDELVKLS